VVYTRLFSASFTTSVVVPIAVVFGDVQLYRKTLCTSSFFPRGVCNILETAKDIKLKLSGYIEWKIELNQNSLCVYGLLMDVSVMSQETL